MRPALSFKATDPNIRALMEVRYLEEFKMPPVGITETRFTLTGTKYVRFSVRCDIEGCWFAGGSFSTRDDAQKYLDDHGTGRTPYSVPPCTAPPRRESLPSGLNNLEKLWAEMDDIVESLATGNQYRDMTPAELKGYAKGVAFSIVLLDTSFFPDIAAVSAHARDRRKMRLGEIPYRSTPTRHSPAATVQQVEQLHNDGPAPKPPKPARQIPDNVRRGIQAGLASGMFSAQELAETYKLTVEEVTAITGT